MILSRSQPKAKFFDFLSENILIFVVLSGHFQRLESVTSSFCFDLNNCINIAGEVKSYPDIAAATLGPVWSNVVHTATAISCLGGCVGFLIFLGMLFLYRVRFLSLCLFVCLSVFACLLVSLPACLSVCLPACLP